jgi:hypothetical protein
MDTKLNRQIIERIFRMSEGAISPITGKSAHTGERHTNITNMVLKSRTIKENGEIELFTAFISLTQAVDVAELIFNHPSVVPKLERLYRAVEGERSPGASCGEEVITHDIGKKILVRYKGGSGMIPTSLFHMVLHKKVGFPFNLLIYTFYPTLSF